jgi:hypothetical protein
VRESVLTCLLEWAGVPRTAFHGLWLTPDLVVAVVLGSVRPLPGKRRRADAVATLSAFLRAPPGLHRDLEAFRGHAFSDLHRRWKELPSSERRPRLWRGLAMVHGGWWRDIVAGETDGPDTLRDVVGAVPRPVRPTLREAEAVRSHVDSRYATHLHAAQRSTVEQHPLLWTFPVLLARSLERHRVPNPEAGHFVALAVRIADSRVLASPAHRLAERVRRAVARDVAGIVACLCDREPHVSLRALLPFCTRRDHLLDVMAHVLARIWGRKRSTACCCFVGPGSGPTESTNAARRPLPRRPLATAKTKHRTKTRNKNLKSSA